MPVERPHLELPGTIIVALRDWVQAQLQALRPAEREALAWAYQLVGARWWNREALDNLSDLLEGKQPRHEWPVVPPAESAEPSDTAWELVERYRRAHDQEAIEASAGTKKRCGCPMCDDARAAMRKEPRS